MDMPTLMSQANAAHYIWGAVCDGWHLLNRPDLSVILERVPPGASEQRHRHQRARQFFFVLAGQALLEIDGTSLAIPPHSGVEVPPGAAHCLRNVGAEDVLFLVVSAPHSHGDRELVPES